MIRAEDINIALGERIDESLKEAGIPTTRRRPDDNSEMHRRSIQINLEGLHIEPQGSFRSLVQDVAIYFYPADADQPRDEIWLAAMAIETAFSEPLIVDGAVLRLADEVYVDMSSIDIAEITLQLTWIETAEITAETVETIETEVN